MSNIIWEKICIYLLNYEKNDRVDVCLIMSFLDKCETLFVIEDLWQLFRNWRIISFIEMYNSLLVVRDINHKYIVVEGDAGIYHEIARLLFFGSVRQNGQCDHSNDPLLW